MRNLALLSAGTALVWLLLAIPARLAWGDRTLLESGVAALLCWVPMAATLAWWSRTRGSSPEARLAAVMGGTGIRLVFVILCGILLYRTVAELSHPRFMAWLIVFYLVTLALEVWLAVRQQTVPHHPQS